MGPSSHFFKVPEEEGFFHRDRSLGIYLSPAIIGCEACGELQLESLAKKPTDGSIAPPLNQLLNEKKMEKPTLNRLRKLLEGARKCA